MKIAYALFFLTRSKLRTVLTILALISASKFALSQTSHSIKISLHVPEKVEFDTNIVPTNGSIDLDQSLAKIADIGGSSNSRGSFSVTVKTEKQVNLGTDQRVRSKFTHLPYELRFAGNTLNLKNGEVELIKLDPANPKISPQPLELVPKVGRGIASVESYENSAEDVEDFVIITFKSNQ